MANWSIDNWLTLLGLVGGAGAFSVGLRQYFVAQRWKRMEWIASAVRAFSEDPASQRAMQMIDWNERRILLFPDHPNPELRHVRVNDDLVARALMPHKEHGAFLAVEAAIRDTFDRFLDQLALFHQFTEAGLVSPEHLRTYLGYWLRNIGDIDSNSGPSARLRGLHVYIKTYQFTDVEKLFELFNYPLRSQSSEELLRLSRIDTSAILRELNDPSKFETGFPAVGLALPPAS